MTPIETHIAISTPHSTRNGKLTGKAQLIANAITAIEAYARKGRFPPKRTAYRLTLGLASYYGFFVRWEEPKWNP